MSKHLAPINIVQTTRAEFTTEDKEALGRYSSFTGFEVNNVKLARIFSEFTDSVEHEAFTLPEKVGEVDFWPEVETYLEN